MRLHREGAQREEKGGQGTSVFKYHAEEVQRDRTTRRMRSCGTPGNRDFTEEEWSSEVEDNFKESLEDK